MGTRNEYDKEYKENIVQAVKLSQKNRKSGKRLKKVQKNTEFRTIP